MSWGRRPLEPPPPLTPERRAWQLLFTSGSGRESPIRPGDPVPESAVLTGAAGEAMAIPAAIRYVLDFDGDGYLLRGSFQKDPGPWTGPPIGT